MTTNFTIPLSSGEELPVLRVGGAKPGPLLVIVPSIFGITPDVTHFAESFAAQHALVYVLDPFWRRHPGPLSIPQGTRLALQRKNSLDPEELVGDLVEAISYGKSEAACNQSVILLGICFGGTFVVRAADHTSLQGLAVWHGSRLLSVLKPSTLETTDVRLDFGASDPLIPLSEVEEIRRLLPQTKQYQIEAHPHAGHGFSHVGTAKENVAAAQSAHQKVIALIKRYRGSP